MADPDPTDAVRILLVDRSEAFLAGVGAWIADRPDVALVGEARTGSEALLALERTTPDVVVIDGIVRELGGLNVVRALKQRPRPPFVVVATFLATTAAREAAFAAGADGFLAKDDFVGAFELVLAEFRDRSAANPSDLRRPARSTRPGSRTEPAP